METNPNLTKVVETKRMEIKGKGAPKEFTGNFRVFLKKKALQRILKGKNAKKALEPPTPFGRLRLAFPEYQGHTIKAYLDNLRQSFKPIMGIEGQNPGRIIMEWKGN